MCFLPGAGVAEVGQEGGTELSPCRPLKPLSAPTACWTAATPVMTSAAPALALACRTAL